MKHEGASRDNSLSYYFNKSVEIRGNLGTTKPIHLIHLYLYLNSETETSYIYPSSPLEENNYI